MKRIARDCVVLALILSASLVAGAVGVYFEFQSRQAVAGAPQPKPAVAAKPAFQIAP